MSTLSQLLGSYAYNLKYDSLSKEAMEKAKTCVLHDLGMPRPAMILSRCG